MRKIAKLWRGALPLNEAFWTWAVFGGVLVNLATSGIFLALIAADRPLLALLAGYGLSLPYNLLALVGVWRSAARYEAEPDADRAWANTARGAALIGLVLLSVT